MLYGQREKKNDLKTEHTRIFDMQAFANYAYTLCVRAYTNEPVFSTTSHALLCNQKQYLCASCTARWSLSPKSPGTGPVLPRCKLMLLWGRGGGRGWGWGVFWKPHWLADIAGHDGCCQHCCLATQYPSRKSSGLAGSKKASFRVGSA